jgi:hypothetical protein
MVSGQRTELKKQRRGFKVREQSHGQRTRFRTEYGLKDKGPGSRRGHESRPDEKVQE